ncbi:uncharacterized protein [Mytilus edulis]|uniref:uncharacterized protein n=1 Tax=Mytilus edulis TaxID=6550 RepID=UPI0039F05717
MLIKAVNQLCDGMPDEQTVSFLKQLDRPLNVPNHEVTKLFGTNFDAQFINHEMLEEIDEDLVVYKAEDEGNVRILRDCVAPKSLLLKKGAKVILVKNITQGLCNGMQGVVHHVAKDILPIINFNGKLVTLERASFDVFDLKQQKNLASRKQFPVILAFALTVHRAQGQTLQNVEVDSFSFFAPGQMGVAVGRAVSIDGLRLVNYNSSAANKKHPDIVYEFYDRVFNDFLDDLSCCKDTFVMPSVECPPPDDPTDQDPDDTYICMDMDELPVLASPWDIFEFQTENKSAPFMSDISPDFFVSLPLKDHVNYLYYNVDAIVSAKLDNSDNWINAYTKLNEFVLSDKHILSIQKLFKVNNINKYQNKLSTKIVFWLMNKEIEKKAKAVTAKQITDIEAETSIEEELSSAGKSKIRYLTGACVQKITKRLKESVLRKMGQSTKKSKLAMRMDYKKQCLLKQFRISELDVADNDESMVEIDFKQGPSRGLTIPNDSVFNFFLSLHSVLQHKLSLKQMHLYLEDLHNHCRNAVDNDDVLIGKWISLFDIQDDGKIEDELFLTLIMELYRDVTEHFIRISFVDSLKYFKRTIPRKKNQALRTKIQALGDRQTPSSSKVVSPKRKNKCSKDDEHLSLSKKKNLAHEWSESEIYICSLCMLECDWEPAEMQFESIACDKCNCWFHYKCVNIKGTEKFLKKDQNNWFCPNCSRKGKGKGKGRGRGKST